MVESSQEILFLLLLLFLTHIAIVIHPIVTPHYFLKLIKTLDLNASIKRGIQYLYLIDNLIPSEIQKERKGKVSSLFTAFFSNLEFDRCTSLEYWILK